MTLGEQLRKSIQKTGRKQLDIATEWAERWKASENAERSPQTVEAHLSRCLSDQAASIRFFFHDRARAVLLFEILGTDEKNQKEILEAADMVLAAVRSPTVVIEAPNIPGAENADQFFIWAERELRDAKAVQVTVLVTEAQYKRLPRSFDDYEDHIDIERVKDGEAARKRTMEIARDGLLVVSGRIYQPVNCWLAARMNWDVLETCPEDGVAQFQKSGRLDTPAEIVDDLEEFFAPSKCAPELPSDPLKLRRLIFSLADPRDSADSQPPETRLAWAKHIGVRAGATPRELLSCRFSEIVSQLDPKNCSVEEFDAYIERAATRPPVTKAFWVEGKMHVVNPTEQTAALLSGTRHAKLLLNIGMRSALELILDRVRDWNVDDWADDPALIELTTALASQNPKSQAQLLHARAAILWSRDVKPAPRKPETDWQTALTSILIKDPPKPVWRVNSIEKLKNEDHYNSYAFESAGRYMLSVEDVKVRLADQGTKDDLSLIGLAPPLGPTFVSAGDEIGRVTTHEKSQGQHYSSRPPVLDVLLAPPGQKIDHVLWLEMFERSRAFSSGISDNDLKRFHRNERNELPSDFVETMATVPEILCRCIVEENDDAIATIGIVWMALRRALRMPSVIRLPDGSTLLELQGGICARLRAYRNSSNKQLRAAFCTSPWVSAERGRNFTAAKTACCRQLTTHWGGGYHAGPLVPVDLWLSDGPYSIDVSFEASPLLGEVADPGIDGAIAQEHADELDDIDDN